MNCEIILAEHNKQETSFSTLTWSAIWINITLSQIRNYIINSKCMFLTCSLLLRLKYLFQCERCLACLLKVIFVVVYMAASRHAKSCVGRCPFTSQLKFVHCCTVICIFEIGSKFPLLGGALTAYYSRLIFHSRNDNWSRHERRQYFRVLASFYVIQLFNDYCTYLPWVNPSLHEISFTRMFTI